MDDHLVLADRVRNDLAAGEGHFVEFKSALEGPEGTKKPRRWASIARDIGEALVSFANAEGGDLIVGIEDRDASISGVPHPDEDVAQLLNAPRTHVADPDRLPLRLATKVDLEGKIVLLFSVLKVSSGVMQLPDGRCVRRDGLQTIPESAEKILFSQRERQSRAFDSEFVDGAHTTDLRAPLLADAANEYLRGITPEQYLQQLGLAEYTPAGLKLRRAALLLFANDVVKWHPRSQVRVLRVAGEKLGAGDDYNVVSDEYATGNVLDLLVRSWELLRPFLAFKTDLGADTRFQQRYIYPEDACREALVNAITHRDYSVSRPVEVYIFSDRMEIRSPGALLSTLTVGELNRLKGAHESRNALIARALREARYVRELGEGMRRMFQLMEQNDLRRPLISSDESTFSITLYNKSVYTEQQTAWIEQYAAYHLSPMQQRIVVAGMGGAELSADIIMDAMNTKDRNTYDKEVTRLRNSGILQEIRTNLLAGQLARESGQRKSAIPRFKVLHPSEVSKPPQFVANVKLQGVPLKMTRPELRAALAEYGELDGVRMGARQRESRLAYVRFVNVRLVDELVSRGMIDLGGFPVSIRRL